MTTLATLRARLRVVLGDNAAAGYLWQDGVLNRHLDDAVRAYSRFFQREAVATITTVAGQAEYDLPAGASAVVRVEMVEDESVLVEGGDCYGVGYRVWGGKLILMPAPEAAGKTVKLWYLAPHAGLAADADVVTVPAGDEDLLVAFAAARALEGLASEDAKRRRFEERAGRPAASVGRGFLEELAAGVAARRARLRTSRLAVR